MSFDISIERRDAETFVISVAGDLDLRTAPDLKVHSLEAVESGGREVILDLTETTFIDSTALGAIVGGVKRLRSIDGELALVCSDRSIVRIFQITGLDRIIPMHRSLHTALSSTPVAV